MAIDILKSRDYKVVKDNKLIQEIARKTFQMSMQEQKVILYILSLIKKEDDMMKPPYIYKFNIKDYCDLCGISHDGGGNIKSVKNSLAHLTDYKFWLKDEGDIYFQWIVDPEISEDGTTVEVEIPSKTFKYLVGLSKHFTEYRLWQILPLKNKYSIAMYEFCKSYLNLGGTTITLYDLRNYLSIDANKYLKFNDFSKRILYPIQDEINTYTDLYIEWSGIRTGRNFTSIKFDVMYKNQDGRREGYFNSKIALDG